MEDNIINRDTCSVELPEIGRRAYINSVKGRADLKADCAQTNSPEVYTEVMAVWGDTPTVEDEVLPAPTFNELKAAKRDEIAAARYAAETGGCTVDGVTIATDRGSQALLTAAVVTARLDPEFKTRWKCADGHFVTLDAMQLRAIGNAVIAHVEACFAREAELCELVDAAQTPEDLDAIKWSM
jgi:hypothetical protein